MRRKHRIDGCMRHCGHINQRSEEHTSELQSLRQLVCRLLLEKKNGSAVCWWPAIIEPSLDFPGWILFVLVAFSAGASILLCGLHAWLEFFFFNDPGTSEIYLLSFLASLPI